MVSKEENCFLCLAGISIYMPMFPEDNGFLKECCGHDSLPKLESISLFGEAMCLGRLWPYLLVNLIVLTPVLSSLFLFLYFFFSFLNPEYLLIHFPS